jgi:hypothetical protein
MAREKERYFSTVHRALSKGTVAQHFQGPFACLSETPSILLYSNYNFRSVPCNKQADFLFNPHVFVYIIHCEQHTDCCLFCLKGTHARDFNSLFLNFLLHISVTNRYKTQSSQHFQKYSSNSHRYSKFSITRRFRRKREARLSVVAKNAELNLALSL